MGRGALVVLVVAGCGRLGFDPATGSGSGATGPDAGDRPCAFGPWSAPGRIASVSTMYNEFAPALSADTLTLLFETDRMGGRDLYMATRATTTDAFGPPTALAQINTPSAERDPTLSIDGRTLYFTSDRTGLSRLYRSTRSSTTAEFGAPSPVNELATISLAGPALSADGDELFYSDWTESTLIRATYSPSSGFVPDGTVTALDVGFANASPSLSGDGRTIYYQHQEGLIVPAEIYAAHRTDPSGAFGAEVALTELGAPSADTGNPEISKDERTIVFSSDRQGGSGGFDLYIANRTCQ